MAIKISKVLRESEERKAAVPPLPRVKSKGIDHPPDEYQGPGLRPPVILPSYSELQHEASEKELILKDLYDQLAHVKRDRNQLSSQNAPMVTRINEQLKEKSKGMAEEFMAGRMDMPEIKEHYERIQGLTDRAITLWDQIHHVEKYGELPGVKEGPQESSDEQVVKLRLRSVIDAICKTRRKLKVGKAYNPARIIMWEEKISHLEATQLELITKLKKIQFNARNTHQG